MNRKIFSLRILIIFFALLISTKSKVNSQPFPIEKNKIYNEAAGKIVRSALSDNKGYGWLKELCSIGPRLSGSENSAKAIIWAKNKI